VISRQAETTNQGMPYVLWQHGKGPHNTTQQIPLGCMLAARLCEGNPDGLDVASLIVWPRLILCLCRLKVRVMQPKQQGIWTA